MLNNAKQVKQFTFKNMDTIRKVWTYKRKDAIIKNLAVGGVAGAGWEIFSVLASRRKKKLQAWYYKLALIGIFQMKGVKRCCA